MVDMLSRAAVVFGALALVLTLGSTASSRPPAARAGAGTRKTFATPEAAVTQYLKAIADGDLDAAIRESAIDDTVAHFDYAARSRDLNMLLPPDKFAPANYAMYGRMNKLEAMSEFAQATKEIVYGILMGGDTGVLERISATDAKIAAFIKERDPARLKTLKVVRVDQPHKSVMTSAKVIATSKKIAALYGAAELTERIALLQLDGEHYRCGFQLLRYGNTWRLHQVHYGGPGAGQVERTTAEEYEALLK
jgi:hypothetical protein